MHVVYHSNRNFVTMPPSGRQRRANGIVNGYLRQYNANGGFKGRHERELSRTFVNEPVVRRIMTEPIRQVNDVVLEWKRKRLIQLRQTIMDRRVATQRAQDAARIAADARVEQERRIEQEREQEEAREFRRIDARQDIKIAALGVLGRTHPDLEKEELERMLPEIEFPNTNSLLPERISPLDRRFPDTFGLVEYVHDYDEWDHYYYRPPTPPEYSPEYTPPTPPGHSPEYTPYELSSAYTPPTP